MKSLILISTTSLALFGWMPNLRAQHAHLNIGAASTAQGAPLTWDNGPEFADASGYVKYLEYTNAGLYASYFQGNITLTVLPATAAFGGPAPNAPSVGAKVHARMTLLSAPAGGEFGLWETNSTTVPGIVLRVGETNSTAFTVSSGSGQPGSDPYGHVHGRRFTASKPGLYKMGFQAFDASINGDNGQPIHTPSGMLSVWFQAGPTIGEVIRSNAVAHVRYGSIPNRTFYLETTTDLDSGNWTTVATNKSADYFRTMVDTSAGDEKRFYRLRVTNP